MSSRFSRPGASAVSSLVLKCLAICALNLCASARAETADFAVQSIVASPSPITRGENITYVISLANHAVSAPAAEMTVTLPPALSFVSLSSPANWSATTPAVGTNGTITASTSFLSYEQPTYFTLVAKVGVETADGTTLTLTASVAPSSSSDNDPTPANNFASVSATVLADAPPFVVSILRKVTAGSVPAATTTASSVTFRVTFSEPVTGVDVSDFALTTAITATGSITSVTQVSGSIYDVVVGDLAGGGPIRLDLKTTATISDSGSNSIGSAGFAVGQRYTHVDTTTPITWGTRLGVGSLLATSASPLNVWLTGPLAGKTVTALASSPHHTTALTSDGELFAWGYNANGLLGNNSTTDSNTPIRVNTDAGTSSLAGKTVVAIAAGSRHVLALASDGTVHAWGGNPNGGLGDGTTITRLAPVLVGGALAGKTIVAIAAGGAFSVAVDSDGAIYTWGSNFHRELGGPLGQQLSPIAINMSGALAGKFVTAVSATGTQAFALTADGSLFGWGGSGNGSVGDGTGSDRSVPVPVAAGVLSGKRVVAIDTSFANTIALTSDGALATWGLNDYGTLGNGTTTSSLIPVAVSMDGALAGKTIVDVGMNSLNAFALSSDGLVYGWGVNLSGQVGDGSLTNRLVPTAVDTTGRLAGRTVAALGRGEASRVIMNGIFPLPTITSATTASGTVGTPFSYSITTAATAQSFSFTGTLPTGLSLNSTTGVISGTPTAVANSTVTLNATNDGGTATASLTLTIDKGSQTIAFPTPADRVFGDPPINLTAARFNAPTRAVQDTSGNLFVVDALNHTIRKVTPAGAITTFAGTASSTGTADGTGAAARFNTPIAAVVDSSGNLFVTDQLNHTIRKITPAGAVTTFAGTAGSIGGTDGTGNAARFAGPSGIAIDASDNLYVSEFYGYTIRKITPAAVVTTLAGTYGSPGSVDGTGAAARFTGPNSLAVDSAGNVFVADSFNHTIRHITPAGVVTTFAGTAGTSGTTDGTGSAARFNTPRDVAVDATGTLYVVDSVNHTIRQITAAAVVTTLAGSAGNFGTADGTGAAARFNAPYGILIANSSTLYVSDTFNHAIRRLTTSGVVTTFVGVTGVTGSDDGAPALASSNAPLAITYRVVSGPATIADRQLTLTGTGTVVLRASQAGNANWNAATDVDVTFRVTGLQASVTLSSLAHTYDGSAKSAAATTSPANLNVTFTYNGSATPPTAAGSYTVVATVDDALYSGSATDTLVISAPTNTAQTIAFSAPPDNSINDSPFTLIASSSSGLPVTFTIVSGPAMIVGNVVTLTGAAGTVIVKASQSGGSGYGAAADVFRTFTVRAADTRTFFGDFFSNNSASISSSAHRSVRALSSKVGDVAASLPARTNDGSLLVVAPSVGLNALIPFTLQADSTYTASATQVLPGQTPAQRAVTVRGQLVNNILSGSFDDLGLSFSASVEPRDGPSADAAGLYRSSALATASGTLYTIVGSENNVLVLFLSPTLTAGGLTSLEGDNTFDLQVPAAGGNLTLLGSLDRATTTVNGSLVLPSGIGVDFAGLKTTTLRTDRLISLASRGRVGAGEKLLISGFVINGPAAKPVLVRGVGPGLSSLGVQAVLADPRIRIFHGSTLIAENDNWDAHAVAAIAARVGAFALPDGSKDAAFVATLEPGAYTAHITGGEGVALAEIYDASENPQSEYQRLIDIATRGEVGTGENILIGGFVIAGNAPKRVLVRGVGPTLATQGVAAPLADPVLKVFAGSTIVAENNDWGSDAAITAAETAVGAFHLASGSKDAALLLTLKPGLYTVHVAGANNTTGVALVEIYEVAE